MSGDEADDARRRALAANNHVGQNANQLGGGGLLPQAQGRVEKPATSINCKDFRSDVDDFEQWVTKFERAVKLATNVRDDDQLAYLYKEWLPLKLDDAAYAIWMQTTKTRWLDLREELIGLLVDPQEKYKWQAKLTTIKWDGKESFHALASRVKRAVDKYDKEMSQDYKNREYYFRFRAAFKKPMRRCIDMGCSEGNRTIEAAKDIVLRYQITTADDEGHDKGESDDLRGVAFASASLHPDRATSIETTLAGIVTKLEDMSISIRDNSNRLASFENQMRDLRRDVDRNSSERRSRDEGYQQGSGYRSNSRGSNQSSGYNNNYRGNNQASQNTNYDRNQGASYDGRGRNNSRDGRGQGGGQNRNRSYSNDRRNSGRNNQRDDNRGDDRGGRRDDRRDNAQGNRDGGQGNRDNRRGNDRRDNQRNSNRDAYRAIDTADEDSSGESVTGEEPSSSRTDRGN